MTTKKQLARLFRDVVKHNPDFVQVNPYAIWIRPIRHADRADLHLSQQFC